MSRTKWRLLSVDRLSENTSNAVLTSVGAIVETCISVFIAWYIAYISGTYYHILLGIAVGPLLLLRSRKSNRLALAAFLRYERRLGAPRRRRTRIVVTSILIGALYVIMSWHIYKSDMFIARIFLLGMIFAVPLMVLVPALLIRMTCTLIFLRDGFDQLPSNFRRLTLFASPLQIPEVVPGLQGTGSRFRIDRMVDRLLIGSIREIIYWLSPSTSEEGLFIRTGNALYILFSIPNILLTVIATYIPSIIYRMSVKSTFWFWWPLIFISGKPEIAKNPDIFHMRVRESLWGKSTLALSVIVLAILFWSIFFWGGIIFEKNPLITPLGYFLLIDSPTWYAVAMAMAATLSVVIVFVVDYAAREKRIFDSRGANVGPWSKKLYFAEILLRIRLVLLLFCWSIVLAHTTLYINHKNCVVWIPDQMRVAVSVLAGTVPDDSCAGISTAN